MPTLIRSPIVDCRPPDWASGWGQDEYGYFAEFSVKTGPLYWDFVTQRMRWIPPGTFLMGSPEDEQERGDDELQHEVTINEGFWLADTTCPQGLWEAVMSKNSSEFQGGDLPVDSVSFGDVHEFFDRVLERISTLQLQLPTEAQWEYACRSGTTSAFSFGAAVSTDEVNCNGNYPMPESPKGEYRETTINCRSLPPNAWGLYQMHGNVWEWCRDWYGEYDQDESVDPINTVRSSSRVVRGGSWFSDGRLARRACRGGNHPDDRSGRLGFRCLSSVKPVAEQASATRSEPRDEAAE